MRRRAAAACVALYAFATTLALIYALSSDEPLAGVWLFWLGLPTSALAIAADDYSAAATILIFWAGPLQVAALALLVRQGGKTATRDS